jgi:hypothetical protein
MRDDFLTPVIEMLAKRVGHRCSNPECDQLTSGPQVDPTKAVNVGVAAHITAASPNGPRYDASLTPEQRKAIENGIWLCQKCGKLVDNDEARYTVLQLREWKRQAEERALKEVEGGPRRQSTVNTTAAVLIQGPNAVNISGPNAVHLGPGAIKIEQHLPAHSGHAARIARLEKQMPELLAEMRNDLKAYPLRREFVLLKKGSSYWAGGDELMYYFEDHDELESKVRILANLRLVQDITFNDVARYQMTEEFVEYLMS